MNLINRERAGQPSGRQWSTVLIWVSLALLVAASTVILVRQTAAMNGGMGLMSGTMGLSVPLFLLLWVPMMAAMMLLSAAPLVTLAVRMVTTGPTAVIGASQLVIGYLSVWTLAGIPAYFVLQAAGGIIERVPDAAPWVSAALLIAAGAYQWLPLKYLCLRHCRSPLAFLMHMAEVRGPLRGLRIGVRHGWFCLGCCWALMLALLALGMMNLVLMAGFAVAIFIEKTWRYGMGFAHAVGIVLILLGLVILAFPELAAPLLMPG